jgi:hypothetical protein
MKYCCQKFQVSHQAQKNMGLNIRVIKLTKQYINESERRGFPIKKNELYSFIITENYEEKLTNKGQSTFINYCPYCGKKLNKYYSKDDFINETNHDW